MRYAVKYYGLVEYVISIKRETLFPLMGYKVLYLRLPSDYKSIKKELRTKSKYLYFFCFDIP